MAIDAAAQEALEGPLEGRAEEGLQVLMAHMDIFRRRVWVVLEEEEEEEEEGGREDGEEEGVAGLTTATKKKKKKRSGAPAGASPTSPLGQAIAAFQGAVDYAEGENLPPSRLLSLPPSLLLPPSPSFSLPPLSQGKRSD